MEEQEVSITSLLLGRLIITRIITQGVHSTIHPPEARRKKHVLG